jgi:3'-phosphoadenosine 5'-phosphosulfate sulfotransferase (PAPS reductase)/FAD synthetase
MFPTPAVRQCTSDLKRGPIEKAGRHFLVGCPCCETNSSLECNIRTKRDLRFNGIVVNCMGIRAGESAKRAKNNPLKFNASNSKAGRTWFDYLPILDFNCHTDNGFKAGMKDEVIDTILSDGKELHPAYGFDAETRTCTKMKRLSCMFCIMASKTDLALSAKANPEPYARMIATEKVIGHTFAPSANKDGSRSGLEEHIGLPGNKKLIELWVAKLAPQHAVLTEMRESGEKLSAALLVARAL